MNTLEHHFLIAMPSLMDPNFHKSIVYIYEHTEMGAMGLIINKPMRVTLSDILKHLSIPIKKTEVEQLPVLLGGPVAQEQGFIVTPTNPLKEVENPIAENAEISISTSKATLEVFAQGKIPADLLVTLGYCSWAAGQLEEELIDNAWLIAPYDKSIFFHAPYERRWRLAAASIGVDLSKLMPDAGHA